MAPLTFCVHGRWTPNEICQCDQFWRGIDCSLRTCVNGILNATTFECRCRIGYGGEFCQSNMCQHNDRWYCDDYRLCNDESLRSWTPISIDDDAWKCSCGSGRLVFSNATNSTLSSCQCTDGFFGEFCQFANSCRDASSNGTCFESGDREKSIIDSATTLSIDRRSETDRGGGGVWGFDLSSELLLASLLMAVFLIALLVLIRLCVRKFNCHPGDDGSLSSEDYLQRIAVDEFRSRRSSPIRYPAVGGGVESGQRNGFGKKTNGCRNEKTNAPRLVRLNDVLAWRNATSQNVNYYSARPIAFHRLTTVLEEEVSDVDERLTE